MPDPEILEIRKNLYLFIEGKISGYELARRVPAVKQENLLFEEGEDDRETILLQQ